MFTGQESSPTELNEKPAVKVKKKRPRVQVPDQFLEDYCIIMEKQGEDVAILMKDKYHILCSN